MRADSPYRLITTAQMYAADQLTIASGISERQLINNAAAAVCAEITAHYEKCSVLVLVGPGNNGADGLKTVELLQDAGWSVTVWKFDEDSKLPELKDTALIIDALFGAGLSKPLRGNLLALVNRINTATCAVVSIDIPTGIDGNTGQARPIAVKADRTVTFFRQKPGHMLYPGRAHCGQIICRDIDIAAKALNKIAAPYLYENAPRLWQDGFPKRRYDSHKYKHGHVLCVSGGMRNTGAVRLAAKGALRIGAGLVSITAPGSALMIHAAHLTEIMLEKADNGNDLAALVEDIRKNVILIGPGLGLTERGRDMVEAALSSKAALVLDADALTLYKNEPEFLFARIKNRNAPVILTPHAGEFTRLFAHTKNNSKIDASKQAAKISGAIIVYKGADTIITAPDGTCVLNTNASPHLATAGSGDVLAGMIAGLLAQNMPPLKSACAGVWLHGAAGRHLGPGLIAGDIPNALPKLLKQTFYGD